MRKNFGTKVILYPKPVLIIGTYDENGKPNTMNAAWSGISEKTQISIASGNKEPDKIEKADWHATKSEFVDAPLFDELPMALECKLISYDKETCRLVDEIVNVCVEERILDENGKIDLNKFSPLLMTRYITPIVRLAM